MSAEVTPEQVAEWRALSGCIAVESIRATEQAIANGAETCICAEGPYFGAQLSGTPIRCERCKRIAYIDHVTSLAAAVPALLDEVERLTAERDWLREERYCPGCGRPQDWTGETSPGAPCMGCGRYPAARTNGAEAERDAALRDVAILRPAAAHAERAEAELRALREGVETFTESLTEQGEHHVHGCMGQADCAACVQADLRALLSDGPSA